MAFSFPTIKEFLKTLSIDHTYSTQHIEQVDENFITDLLLQKNIIVQLYMKMIRSPL